MLVNQPKKDLPTQDKCTESPTCYSVAPSGLPSEAVSRHVSLQVDGFSYGSPMFKDSAMVVWDFFYHQPFVSPLNPKHSSKHFGSCRLDFLCGFILGDDALCISAFFYNGSWILAVIDNIGHIPQQCCFQSLDQFVPSRDLYEATLHPWINWLHSARYCI